METNLLHGPNKELHYWELFEPRSLDGRSYNVVLSPEMVLIFVCTKTGNTIDQARSP